MAAVEAVSIGNGCWVKNLQRAIEDFGWKDMDGSGVEGLSGREVADMLESCAWRMIQQDWWKDIEERPKLSVLRKVMELGCEARCVNVDIKRHRRILMRLRGGTAQLRIETGRWRGVSRELRWCQECGKNEVEDVVHWLLRCEAWRDGRKQLLSIMNEVVEGFDNLKDEDKMAWILEMGCREVTVMRKIEDLWNERFDVIRI